jgi:hypothetical protein
LTRLERLVMKHITQNYTLNIHDVGDYLEDYEDVELAVEMYDLPAFSDFSLQEITEEVELFRRYRPDRELA